jgi:hypothetical protein
MPDAGPMSTGDQTRLQLGLDLEVQPVGYCCLPAPLRPEVLAAKNDL